MKQLIIMAFCLLMPISAAIAEQQNYIFIDHNAVFYENDTPSDYRLFETAGRPVALQNGTGQVYQLDENNRVTDIFIGRAIYGDHFEVTPNGYKLFETSGKPVAVGPNGGVYSVEYSTDLEGWDVSGGRIGAIGDTAKSVNDEGITRPIVDPGVVVPGTTKEAVLNRFTRLGSGDRRSSRKEGKPFSISQYLSGRVDDATNMRQRRSYSEEDMEYSLAISPDQVRAKRAAAQQRREERERQEARVSRNSDALKRLTSRAAGSISPYIPTSSGQSFEAIGRPFKIESGLRYYETEGQPIAVDSRNNAYQLDRNNDVIRDQLLGRVTRFLPQQ